MYLTRDVYEKVSRKTNIDIDTITKIDSIATDTIIGALKRGDKVSLIGFGSFSISSQVNIVENNVKGEVVSDIAANSLNTIIQWDPSATTQNKLTNENQKIVKNQTQGKVSNNGRGLCQFGKCFCAPGFVAEGVTDSSNSELAKSADLAISKEIKSNDELKAIDLTEKVLVNSLDQCRESIITQTHYSLKSLLIQTEQDLIDYKDNATQESAERVDNTMKDLKRLAQDIRAEVQEMKNDD